MSKRSKGFRKQLGAAVSTGAIGLCLLAFSSPEAQARPQTFNIGESSLRNGLLEFAQQANVQLIVNDSDLRGLDAKAIRGTYEPEEALRRLINGSPVTASWVGERTLVIQRPQPRLFRTAMQVDSGSAPARTTPAVSEEAASPIADIVVTAQRRAERLQDVPLAVTAVTASLATGAGVVDPHSLARLVPGLQLNRGSLGNTTFLRGVGSSSAVPGVESPVALYVDDVYIPTSGAALANYNSIERIEVLKGPQGTLFGRNATGGVIHVFTRDPKHEPEAEFTLGYANYDTFSGSAYGTTGLADNLAFNIALYTSRQEDGYGTNLTTGRDTYRNWFYGGRAKLAWTPSDRTEFLLAVDYDKNHSENGLYFRPAPGTLSNAGAVSEPPPGLYDTRVGLDPYLEVTQKGVSLKASHEMDFASLVSVTALRTSTARLLQSTDSAPAPRTTNDSVIDYNTFSQELRLVSNNDSWLKWIVGAYYLSHEDHIKQFRFQGAALGFPVSNAGGYIDVFSKMRTHSYSAFGQATAEVLPDTHLTAGLRYTRDERRVTAGGQVKTNAGVLGPVIPSSNSPREDHWSKLTMRFSIDHKFTDDFMVYAAYNTGFRSGTFGMVIFPPGNPILDPVEPETIKSYTAGFKSDLFDRRLRLNAEGFVYKYSNLVLNQSVSTGTAATVLLRNAAAATIKGIDVEAELVPFKNFSLTSAFTIMDAKYDDYPNGQFFVYQPSTGGNCNFPGTALNPLCGSLALPPNWNPATGTWNLEGNNLQQAPDFALNLTARYTIPTSIGDFEPVLSWYHSSRYYFDPDNGLGQTSPSSPNNDRQKRLNILTGSLTWRSVDERFEVRGWVKNITNQRYLLYATEIPQVMSTNPAPPRTYGLTATVRIN